MESARTPPVRARSPNSIRAATEILGIFDSGLGGLTVLRSVRALAPAVDVVYLADQAHVPYGDRAPEDLHRLLGDNVARLEACGVDAIVMGCNSSCAVAARLGWPPARVPILDLIASAAEAVAALPGARIGVLATVATARSGAYGEALRARRPELDVVECAAPELVPLVEAGHLTGPRARAAVAAACAPLGPGLDALVLACTHFPLLDAAFREVLGPRVRLLDPAVAQAERARAFVGERGEGRTRYLTTGSLERYRNGVAAILGPPARLDRFERIAVPATSTASAAR